MEVAFVESKKSADDAAVDVVGGDDGCLRRMVEACLDGLNLAFGVNQTSLFANELMLAAVEKRKEF